MVLCGRYAAQPLKPPTGGIGDILGLNDGMRWYLRMSSF